MSEQMIVELIKIGGLIIAAAVPSLAVLLVNKSRHKNECLKRNLRKALSDLQFMLAVEQEHGRMQKESTGNSSVLVVRKVVHARDHLDWSGAFSAKRIVKKIESLK